MIKNTDAVFPALAQVVGDERPLRCLEFYSGIGGFAVAAGTLGWLVAHAFDINERAMQVYRHNFSHPSTVCSVESISIAALRELAADLWWMSPPCQPFTRRGNQRDLLDPRTAGFLHLLQQIEHVQPNYLAVENVPGFEQSQAAERLRATLTRNGYRWHEHLLCPTQLGVPNRRRRFYLVATCLQSNRIASLSGPVNLGQLASTTTPPHSMRPLHEFLEHNVSRDFFVEPSFASQFRDAMHVVAANVGDHTNHEIETTTETTTDATPMAERARDNLAVTACFTSAYGGSPVRSGSYLATAEGIRRFTPHEILRLLGFPAWYELPAEIEVKQAWRLVGNSLSIPALLFVLRGLPSRSP